MIEVLYKAKVNDVVVDDSFCGDFDRYCYAPEDFITKDCIDCECQWLQNCLNSIHIECYNTYKVCNITVIYVWLIWSTKTREVALKGRSSEIIMWFMKYEQIILWNTASITRNVISWKVKRTT